MRRTSRLIACSLLLVFTGASDATFSGIGRAKDGDSLMVGNREVRLFGIDAPEYSQRCTRGGAQWSCGAEATERLSALVTGREVRCRQISTDQYHRTVAKCSVGGTDINAAMTESGFAVAYRRYSSDYVPFEERAKSAKRGLWSGTFEAPREYRQKPTSLRCASPSASFASVLFRAMSSAALAWRASMQICAATTRMSGRVASPTYVPEAAGIASSEMLP